MSCHDVLLIRNFVLDYKGIARVTERLIALYGGERCPSHHIQTIYKLHFHSNELNLPCI